VAFVFANRVYDFVTVSLATKRGAPVCCDVTLLHPHPWVLKHASQPETLDDQ